MQINKINPTNFNGLLLYKNRRLNTEATIDTKNIIAIEQAETTSPYIKDKVTDIVVKNTFDNKDKNPYLTFSFRQPIKNVLMEYNKACKNELGELGTVENISGYDKVYNVDLVK